VSDHYDFRLACDLRADVPHHVLDTLRYMTREAECDFSAPPDHPVFEAYELPHSVGGVHCRASCMAVVAELKTGGRKNRGADQ